MTDWAEQITEFQRAWLEQQQQLLSGWVGNLQNVAGTSTPQNAWQQTIDAMEQQVNSVLDTQQQSLVALVKTIEQTGNASVGSHRWENQAEEGIELWIDTQHRLWKVWFEMLRNASPATKTPGEALAKNWQDLVDRAVDIQEQWLSGWTNEKSGHTKSSGKQSTKSSTSRQS